MLIYIIGCVNTEAKKCYLPTPKTHTQNPAHDSSSKTHKSQYTSTLRLLNNAPTSQNRQHMHGNK